jgi:WD40 repeat protein
MADPKKEPKQLQILESERQLLCTRFSPDGTHLIAGGMDAQVHRWHRAEVAPEKEGDEKKIEWQPLPNLAGHHAWVGAMGFHPKAKHIFTGDSWGQLRCTDYEGQKLKVHWSQKTAHDGWLRQIAVSKKHLATVGRDGAVRLWSHAGKRIAEWKGAEEIFAVTFQPDGQRVVFGDAKGVVRVWNFTTKIIEREFTLNEFYKLARIQDVCGLTRLVFLEDGKTLLAVGCAPTDGGTMQGIPTLDWLDYATGKSTQRYQFGVENDAFITDVAWHPKGYLLCATSGVTGRGTTFFIRPGEKEPFYSSTKIANIHALALHPDHQHFTLTSTSRGSNGNGRRLDKEGNYSGNTSPVHVFELPT